MLELQITDELVCNVLHMLCDRIFDLFADSIKICGVKSDQGTFIGQIIDLFKFQYLSI